MIDTVHLNLVDYQILPENNLMITSTYDSKGQLHSDFHLFTDTEGAKVYGREANLKSLSYFGISYKYGKHSRLTFSAPSVFNKGNNLNSVDIDGLEYVVDKLEKDLLNNGIVANLRTAKLSRIDFFKNIETDYPYSYYDRIFPYLVLKKRTHEKRNTSYSWKNTQQEYTAYDKVAEIKKNAKNRTFKLAILQLQKNILRFEHRFLKSKKIKKTLLGITTLGDLFDNYEEVEQYFYDSLENQLFNHPNTMSVMENKTLNSTSVTHNKLEAEIQPYYDSGRKQFWSDFLRDLAIHNLVKEHGKNTIKEALVNVMSNELKSSKRLKTHRLNRQISQTEARMVLNDVSDISGHTVSHSDLYNELKSKVLDKAYNPYFLVDQSPELDDIYPEELTRTMTAQINGMFPLMGGLRMAS